MSTNDRWSALSMKDKADLIKLMVENGVTSLDDMKLYYNGGDLVKQIKKIGRKIISAEARRAESYSSKEYTFNQAYKDARSKGQKTFFWNGDYYNTDYEGAHGKQYKIDIESGKAAAWEKQYPNFTNPELRKEKQEELDTYGITNEQTRNKSNLDKRLRNLQAQEYNFANTYSALVGNVDFNKHHNKEEINKDFIKTYGKKGQEVIDAFAKWDKRYEMEDKYMEEVIRRNPELAKSSVGFWPEDEKEKYKKALDEYFIDPQDNPKYKDLATAYAKFSDAFLMNNILRKGESKHKDEFYLLLGYPQSTSIVNVSKYKTGNLPYYYDIGISGSFDASVPKGNHIAGSNKHYDRNEMLAGVPQKIKPYLESRLLEKPNPTTSYSIHSNKPLGLYTISRPENEDFISVWDKFDIDPFGYGNNRPILQIGKPFEYYSRIYPEGKEPDVDSLYKNFKFKDGGNLFDWGGKFPVSRYEDRPDAAFEETLMTRPPEITKQKKYI